MKKIIITISILLTITIIFTFSFKLYKNGKPENKKQAVKIENMNLQSFDIHDVLKKLKKDNPEKLNLFFDDFSMTLSDEQSVISLNFSFIEEQRFNDKKTSVHLLGIDAGIIVKTEILDNGKNFSIKEYIFSIFNVGKSKGLKNNFYFENYFHKDEFANLFSSLKQRFIDDINEKDERLHIEIIPKASHTIYNGDVEIYLVNTFTGDITNIKELSNDTRFKLIWEGESIKGYSIDDLKGISTYTGSADTLKYYFLDEN